MILSPPAPPAYEERTCALCVSALICLRLDEGESVQHVAVPGTVGVAPENANDPSILARSELVVQ